MENDGNKSPLSLSPQNQQIINPIKPANDFPRGGTARG